MIVVFVMAMALAAVLAFATVTVVAVGLSLAVVSVSLPKEMKAPTLGAFLAVAIGFYFASYAYLTKGMNTDTYEALAISVAAPFFATCIAVSITAVSLRIAVLALRSAAERTRLIGSVATIIVAPVLTYFAMTATFDPMAKPRPRNEPRPISLSLEGEPTHCTFADFGLVVGHFRDVVARFPKGTRLRMTPSLDTKNAGEWLFSTIVDGKEVVGKGRAAALTEIRSDGTCRVSSH